MPRSRTLADLLSEASLEALAGKRSVARGQAYYRAGSVEILHRDEREIAGWVAGTETYAVRLWMSRRLLNWACTCPRGERGEFCKHLVATGLTLLANGLAAPNAATSQEVGAEQALPNNGDRQAPETVYRSGTARDGALVADPLVAARKLDLNDPAAIKETIRNAFDTRGFIDYARMPSLVARAAPVTPLLHTYLASCRDPALAFELLTFAAGRGLKTLEHCDDSDGGMANIVGEIAAIHMQAATHGALTPSELARNLFRLQLADGFGFFALQAYLPALGNIGLATYRRLAHKAWGEIPTLILGSLDDNARHRHQLSEIMTTLARMDNDIDALVDVLRRDLTQPYTYLEIAETLSKATRHDEALKWAEDGRKAFKNQLNIPLDDFLVAEYHRRKRHDDAIALRWLRFEAHPNLDGYQRLKSAAGHAKNWNSWRDKALALLRRPKSAKPRTRDVFSYVDANPSVLTEIFLWENDARAALEVARTSECPSHLWLRIARALEEQSPADAIAIYQAQVEPIVRMANNNAYDEAAGILRRICDLMTGTGKGADFAPYLDILRTQHKAKRNFIQRLEGIGAKRPE